MPGSVKSIYARSGRIWRILRARARNSPTAPRPENCFSLYGRLLAAPVHGVLDDLENHLRRRTAIEPADSHLSLAARLAAGARSAVDCSAGFGRRARRDGVAVLRRHGGTHTHNQKARAAHQSELLQDAAWHPALAAHSVGAFSDRRSGLAGLACGEGQCEAVQCRAARAFARSARSKVRRMPCLAGELSAKRHRSSVHRMPRWADSPRRTRHSRPRAPIATSSTKGHCGWPAPPIVAARSATPNLKTRDGKPKFVAEVTQLRRQSSGVRGAAAGPDRSRDDQVQPSSASEKGSARTARDGAIEVRGLSSGASRRLHAADRLPEALRILSHAPV